MPVKAGVVEDSQLADVSRVLLSAGSGFPVGQPLSTKPTHRFSPRIRTVCLFTPPAPLSQEHGTKLILAFAHSHLLRCGHLRQRGTQGDPLQPAWRAALDCGHFACGFL